MSEIDLAQFKIDMASVYTDLRLEGFSNEEIEELKTMKHPLEYLKTCVDIAQGANELNNEELQTSLGIKRRNSD